MKSFILFILFCTISTFVFSNSYIKIVSIEQVNEISEIELVQSDIKNSVLINLKVPNDSNVNKTKLIAISLAITLGAFGVHRLYLGTEPIVPIAYTLTLGGGFLILPLIDIFYIIAAKDINQITDNDNVFIWNKDLEEEEAQESREDL